MLSDECLLIFVVFKIKPPDSSRRLENQYDTILVDIGDQTEHRQELTERDMYTVQSP